MARPVDAFVANQRPMQLYFDRHDGNFRNVGALMHIEEKLNLTSLNRECPDYSDFTLQTAALNRWKCELLYLTKVLPQGSTYLTSHAAPFDFQLQSLTTVVLFV